MKKIMTVIATGLLLFTAAVTANQTSRWDFTHAAHYEVSDPALIRVNTNHGGRAELILQAQERSSDAVADYFEWARTNLTIGEPGSLHLTRAASGTYNSSGVLRSRVLDKGESGPWQMIVSDVENSIFLSRSLKGEVPANAQGLKALYRLNNSFRDEISQQNGTPFGGYTFVTASMLGSHAGQGWNGRYLQTVNSALLNGATQISIAFWIYPRETGAGRRGVIGYTQGANQYGIYRDENGSVGSGFLFGDKYSFAGTAANAAPLNTWSFIAMTWDGTSGIIRMYVNGEFRGQSSSLSNARGPLPQSSPITINRYSFGGQDIFAHMDEVSIWNRRLTDLEIRNMFLALSAVDFRVRSGNNIEITGDFVGSDGTAQSFYLTGAKALQAGGNFNPNDQYLQYEVQVSSDAIGSDTPYVNSVKLITADGGVFHDSALTDFQQAKSVVRLANMPVWQATPYLGLARGASGAFVSSGTYRSQVFDAGANAFWQKLQWDEPSEIASGTTGVVGLWRFNGTWAAAVGGVIGQAAGGAVLIEDTPKLGAGAARFMGGAARVSYALNRAIRSLEVWVAPEGADGGLLELNPGTGGRLAVMVTNGTLRLEGGGAAGVQLFVNANDRARELLPGWNHIALVLNADMTVSSMVLGMAQGMPWQGLADELAVHNRALLKGEVKARFSQGVQQAGGQVRARVRYTDQLPMPDDGWISGIGNGTEFNISGQRYFQYELELNGGGMVTPAISRVRLFASGTYTNATRADFARGSFGTGTRWFGDKLQLIDLADRGPVGVAGASGIAALWRMDEAAWVGDAPVRDSTGQRHGSPVGGANTESAEGIGLASGKFSGSGQYVSLPTVSLPGDFTVSVWFRTSASGRAALVATEPSGSRSYALEINGNGTSASAGQLTLVLNGTGGQVLVPSLRRDLNDGRWHHVAAVRRGQQAHLFVDGVHENSAAITGIIEDYGAGPLYMARYGNQTIYFNGYLDDLSIWQRVMDPGEVGRVSQAGFDAATTATFESTVLDAGGASIWETLAWVADGRYGQGLSAQDFGLVALWRGEEMAGNLTNAAGGANLAVAANGLTYQHPGVFDYAVGFGNNATSSVPHTTTLESGAFSISIWVHPESDNGRTILDKRTDMAGYGLTLNPQRRPEFWLAATNICEAPAPLRRAAWSHLGAVYDGMQMRLYINGKLVSSRTAVGVTVSSGAPLRIGHAYTNGYYSGLMDDIAYYSRALTGTEMAAHYRAGKGTLAFQVRSSDDMGMIEVPYIGPDGTPASWFTATTPGNLLTVGNGTGMALERYFQYRGILHSEDHRFSPTLFGVTVSASRYPETAPWIAPTTQYGSQFLGNLLSFAHTRTSGNDTTDVGYQITGDPGAAATNRWFYYDTHSKRWTVENAGGGLPVYPNQTSSDTDVNTYIGRFYEQVYSATGGLFRFKAFLKSPGDRPVAVSNVTVTAARGRIVVTSPNGQEVGENAWISAVPYDIKWTWTGIVSDNLELAYSTKGYSTDTNDWTVIASSVAKGAGGAGSRTWTTEQTPSGVSSLSNVVVRIRDLNDAAIMDMSDSPFEITQRFRVVSPNGGEHWYLGEQNAIRWESAHALGPNASIYYAADGTNFLLNEGGYMVVPSPPGGGVGVTSNIVSSADNVYRWDTPRQVLALLSTNAKIRVQTPAGGFADDSDGPFSLLGIVITHPSPGQKVKREEPFTIGWRAIGGGPNVHVDLSVNGGVDFETNIYSFVANTDGENTMTWNVTQDEADAAVLRIRSISNGRVIGISPVFTIAGIKLLEPNGGEEWLAGTTNTIRWQAGGAGETVSIFYTDLYAGNDTVWLPIAMGAPNPKDGDKEYRWKVSERVSPSAQVKIQSDEDPNLFSISQNNFNIAGVRVSYPNLFADRLVMGTPAFMTHAAAPLRWPGVKLEISYDREGTWQLLGPFADQWGLQQPFQFTPTYPSRQTKVRATVIGATTPGGAPLTNIVDVSDEYFTVEGLRMNLPAAGSTNTLGTVQRIQWVTAGAGESASLFYSSQGTNIFTPIAVGIFNDQQYPGVNTFDWRIPEQAMPTIAARVKVVSGVYEAMTPPFILRGIRITSPTNGVVLPLGSNHRAAWSFAGMSMDANGRIDLSLDDGGTYTNLAQNYDLMSIPFYDWAIGMNLDPTTHALLRLSVTNSTVAADTNITAVSDRFTLKGIKIRSPAAGAAVKLGDTITIEFIAAAAGTSARIQYSANGGVTYEKEPIAENLPMINGRNTLEWTVEINRTPSTNAVIRVQGTEDARVSAPFTLSGIRVDRPLQYDIWAVNETNLIAWTAHVPDPVFNIDLVYPDSTTWPVAQNVIGSTRLYPLPALALRGQDSITNVVLRVADRQGVAVGLSTPFRLVSQPLIEIVSPTAGQSVKVGQEVNIVWVKGGSMQEEDFRVFFSRDDFATRDEVDREITFNDANNTFSMPWLIEDRLGTAKILVMHTNNAAVFDYSDAFDIVGSFEISFPNGNPGDLPLYANQPILARWWTHGSVTNVNLYFQTENRSWERVNSQPISNRGSAVREETSYLWTLPDIRTDSMWLRVQDADYPQIYDGVTPGPYDDSDHPFGVNYFTVKWEVRYLDNSSGTNEFKHLDKLSVTDSSGWSVTGVESPFTTNYPYGTFDTVWYRQFFNDKVDFRWLSDRDQTRSLLMLPSDTEPDANVMANFVYNPGQKLLTIHAWIERGGRVLHNPDRATIHFFDTDGEKLKQLTSSEVLADGIFRISWENILNPFQTPNGQTRQLRERETYLARVEVMYNRVIYSAAVTYTLSLAPEFEQVQDILDRVESMQTNLTGQVTGLSGMVTNLTGLTTDFRDRAMSSLGTIEDTTTRIETGVERIVDEMGDFTDTVAEPLAMLTNQWVDVLMPTMTNMAQRVQDMAEAAGAEQSRILNRPTTVEFGSTNTILYKTSRGLPAGQVRLVVVGVGRERTMVETASGIYSADLVADWGLGSFLIACETRDAAGTQVNSDRMILEVVLAGADSMRDLVVTVESLESQMTNMTEALRILNDPTAGLSAMMREIGSGVSQVEAALTAAVAGGGIGGSAGQALESLIGGGDMPDDSSLLGRLAGMSGRIEEIFGSASDAARFAMGAKNEAGTAVTALRDLRDQLLTGEFSMEAAMGRIEQIRRAMEVANVNIENIPRAVGAQALQSQLRTVAEQIEEMAKRAGYEYDVPLVPPGGPGTEIGEMADEEMITVLNQNMNEVKVSLDFMQKVLDEKLNEPVILESWMGVE